MKWIPLLLLIQYNIACCQKSINVNDNLLVERWWVQDYGPASGSKQVFEKRLYNNNRILIYTEISKGACNTIDSIIFNYDNNGQLIERIEYLPTDSVLSDCYSLFKEANRINYVYDGKGKLIRGLTTNGDESSSHAITLNLELKDSLNLLEKELAEIEFVISESEKNELSKITNGKSTILKKKFIANFRPGILAQYGVPFDALLKHMTIFIKNHRLIKDEFHFKELILKREYRYENGLIKEIEISVEKNNKDAYSYLEGFNYNHVTQ